MALSIRNPMCERLARALARRTGRGMTEEILIALEERLQKIDSEITSRERLGKIAAECARLPDLDTREPDEIIGYDRNGGFPHGS